jgi:hypothetical protein
MPSNQAGGFTKSQLHEPPRTGEKNAKNGAIRVLSLNYVCFAFACLPALYVEQVNERKLVCA